jgi:ABC-type bacteriocin/lantibiotic exporter with double-glycine peptidase domain
MDITGCCIAGLARGFMLNRRLQHSQEDTPMPGDSHRKTPIPRASLMSILVYLRPYKRQITYALGALLFTAAITLSIGQGVRLIIDQGLTTGSTAQLRHYVQLFLLLVIALALGTFARAELSREHIQACPEMAIRGRVQPEDVFFVSYPAP